MVKREPRSSHPPRAGPSKAEQEQDELSCHDEERNLILGLRDERRQKLLVALSLWGDTDMVLTLLRVHINVYRCCFTLFFNIKSFFTTYLRSEYKLFKLSQKNWVLLICQKKQLLFLKLRGKKKTTKKSFKFSVFWIIFSFRNCFIS